MEQAELNKEIASLIQKVKMTFDKMNVENDRASDPWLILTEVEMLYQKLIVLKYVHEMERKKQQAAIFSNSEAIEEVLNDEAQEKVIVPKEERREEKTIIQPEPAQSQTIKAAPSNNDLKKLIGFNEKILFTRELFNNSAAEYEATITHLNQCPNFSEAQTYINTEMVSKNNIDKENEALEDFVLLVKRRFA